MGTAKEGAAPRNRRIPQEKAEEIVRLGRAGMPRKKIAEKTGYSVSAVRSCLLAAGAAPVKETEMPGLPEVFIIAEAAKPRAYRVRYGGREYIDITEYWIPQ